MSAHQASVEGTPAFKLYKWANISQSLENHNRLSACLSKQSPVHFAQWETPVESNCQHNLTKCSQYPTVHDRLRTHVQSALWSIDQLSYPVQYKCRIQRKLPKQSTQLGCFRLVQLPQRQPCDNTTKGYDMLDQGKAVRTVNTPLTLYLKNGQMPSEGVLCCIFYTSSTHSEQTKRPGKARDLTVSPKHNYE